MPRHSPYALVRLNFFFVPACSLLLELLEFHKQIIYFGLFLFFSEKVLSFSEFLNFTSRWNCSNFTQIGKTLIDLTNLFKLNLLLSSYLFVSYSSYSLFGFQWTQFAVSFCFGLVGSSGLEPPTSRLSGARSNHLSYEPVLVFGVSLSSCSPFLFPTPRRWWRWWESNPWPPACRAGALPAELHPHI